MANKLITRVYFSCFFFALRKTLFWIVEVYSIFFPHAVHLIKVEFLCDGLFLRIFSSKIPFRLGVVKMVRSFHPVYLLNDATFSIDNILFSYILDSERSYEFIGFTMMRVCVCVCVFSSFVINFSTCSTRFYQLRFFK